MSHQFDSSKLMSIKIIISPYKRWYELQEVNFKKIVTKCAYTNFVT